MATRRPLPWQLDVRCLQSIHVPGDIGFGEVPSVRLVVIHSRVPVAQFGRGMLGKRGVVQIVPHTVDVLVYAIHLPVPELPTGETLVGRGRGWWRGRGLPVVQAPPAPLTRLTPVGPSSLVVLTPVGLVLGQGSLFLMFLESCPQNEVTSVFPDAVSVSVGGGHLGYGGGPLAVVLVVVHLEAHLLLVVDVVRLQGAVVDRRIDGVLVQRVFTETRRTLDQRQRKSGQF